MLINVSDNIDEVKRSLKDFERRELPFITALTMNDIAEDVRKDLQKEMLAKFDRPTRFVTNSLFVFRADKKTQRAFVQFKSGPAGTRGDKIIRPHVFGGLRNVKSHEFQLRRIGLMLQDEYAVPGQRASLDRYGNMRTSEYNKILSALGAQRDSAQNRTAASAKRLKGARRLRNFFVPSRNNARLKPGVYERLKTGVKPILRFVREPRYRPRLRWHETAKTTANAVANAHFRARIKSVLRSNSRR